MVEPKLAVRFLLPDDTDIALAMRFELSDYQTVTIGLRALPAVRTLPANEEFENLLSSWVGQTFLRFHSRIPFWLVSNQPLVMTRTIPSD
jgi:hypothetical protein